MKLNNEYKAILFLFKDFLTPYNSRNLSKLVGISHAGMFKLLKKLEIREILKPKRIGKAVIYSLNMNNSVAKREIEMALTLEAQNYAKWIEEFDLLKDILEFVVLFGSIIKDEKSAKDVDILIIADKKEFNKINQIIRDKNRVLNKKIHLILQNNEDFRKDINNKNKVMLDIIKNGIILFGQEKLTKYLEKFFEK